MVKHVDSRTGIELIDRAGCLRLLAEGDVGRLAVVAGGQPEIFPVNYVFDGSAIVFRTDRGTKLSAAGRSRACFEIDEFDRATRSGWSVVAHGRLEEIDEYSGSEYDRARDLTVDPWAIGPKPHLLRLLPTRVTGRRIAPQA